MVTAIVQGMLAHPRRYKPREEDAHMHWHDAIAKEAVDIANAVQRQMAEDNKRLLNG